LNVLKYNTLINSIKEKQKKMVYLSNFL